MSITAIFLGSILALATKAHGEGSFGLPAPIPFNCPVLVPGAAKVGLGFDKILADDSTLPCEQDCQSNHGAAGGSCDSAGNCICNYTYTTLPNNTRVPVLYSSEACTAELCQCSTREYSEAFDTICHGDCSCNHGANTGTCNYEKKACVCNYDAPYNSSVCVVTQLFNLDMSGYPDNFQRAYKAMKQVAQIRNAMNAFTNFMSKNICVPPVFPLTNVLG